MPRTPTIALALVLASCGGGQVRDEPSGDDEASAIASDEEAPIASTGSSEAAPALPACELEPAEVSIVLEVRPDGYRLADTAGMAIDIHDEAELEERLQDRRLMSPTDRTLHVVPTDDVDPARVEEALAIARAQGFDDARRCALDGPTFDDGELAGSGGLGLRGRGGGGTEEGTIGLGGLGTARGQGGGGSGYGRGRSGLSGRPSAPRMTRIRVDSEGLSDQVVRRIASRHRNEVQFCLDTAQNDGAALNETLAVRVVIGPQGAVTSSAIVETAGSESADECVAQAHRRWTFPSDPGETVATIHYRTAGADD